MQNSSTFTEESFEDFLLFMIKENSSDLEIVKLPNT